MPGSNDNKFDPNTDIPDLTDKIYIVTGGSAGIGYGICAHLLQHNCAQLYLLGKKESHIAEAHSSLSSYGDTSRVIPMQLDLDDLSAVDSTARQLAQTLTRLDGLILNAGLGVGPYEESTPDGIDTHMLVNVFSQFHLSMHLLPLLQKTANSRLVLQSSEFHRLGTSQVAFSSLDEINTDIGPSKLYARSKLAQILHAKALARRKSQGKLGFQSNAAPWILTCHPGGVVTGQQDQAVEAYGSMGKLGVKAVRPFMKDPVDEGCRPVLWAATAGVVGERGAELDGAYVVPDNKVSGVSKQAEDVKLQERLWELCGSVLREKLGEEGLGYQM
ncbi:hypothetical protein MBLNU230_g3271t1 [Neophaeotheca triangularis]